MSQRSSSFLLWLAWLQFLAVLNTVQCLQQKRFHERAPIVLEWPAAAGGGADLRILSAPHYKSCSSGVMCQDEGSSEGPTIPGKDALDQWMEQARMEEKALQEQQVQDISKEDVEKEEQLDSFFLVAEEAQDLLLQRRSQPPGPEEGLVDMGGGWAWGWSQRKPQENEEE